MASHCVRVWVPGQQQMYVIMDVFLKSDPVIAFWTLRRCDPKKSVQNKLQVCKFKSWYIIYTFNFATSKANLNYVCSKTMVAAKPNTHHIRHSAITVIFALAFIKDQHLEFLVISQSIIAWWLKCSGKNPRWLAIHTSTTLLCRFWWIGISPFQGI
jgi:hypothetical protein